MAYDVCKIGLWFAFLALLSPLSASALTIQATPSQEAIIEAQWERLNPCIQEHIVHAGLRLIKVKAPHSLGIDPRRDKEPLECDDPEPHPFYHVQAITLTLGHKTVIDGAYNHPEVIMHELGHWFEKDVMWNSKWEIHDKYWDAWTKAVELDFADMDKCDAYDNAYLKSPYEAAAQIFAAQTMGKAYKGKFYDVSGFRRSNAMMAQILAKTCPK